MRCTGYEQHTETGMIRQCTKEQGHEGRHEHKPFSLDKAIANLQCNSRSPRWNDRCILPYGHKGDHESNVGSWEKFK